MQSFKNVSSAVSVRSRANVSPGQWVRKPALEEGSRFRQSLHLWVCAPPLVMPARAVDAAVVRECKSLWFFALVFILG